MQSLAANTSAPTRRRISMRRLVPQIPRRDRPTRRRDASRAAPSRARVAPVAAASSRGFTAPRRQRQRVRLLEFAEERHAPAHTVFLHNRHEVHNDRPEAGTGQRGLTDDWRSRTWGARSPTVFVDVASTHARSGAAFSESTAFAEWRRRCRPACLPQRAWRVRGTSRTAASRTGCRHPRGTSSCRPGLRFLRRR